MVTQSSELSYRYEIMKNFIFLSIFVTTTSILGSVAPAAATEKCASVQTEISEYSLASSEGNVAKQASDRACLEIYLKSSQDPSILSQALQSAANADDADFSKLLLDHGANPGSANSKGGPFLSIFVQSDQRPVTSTVQTFANSKKVDSKELSIALSYCTVADRHSIPVRFNFATVKSLVENGADVNYVDDNHKSILDLAETSCASLKTGISTDAIQNALAECNQMLPYLKSKGAKDSNPHPLDYAKDVLNRFMNMAKSCL
jgi:ankyrin repeat protein